MSDPKREEKPMVKLRDETFSIVTALESVGYAMVAIKYEHIGEYFDACLTIRKSFPSRQV
jgi:hypothetical protein